MILDIGATRSILAARVARQHKLRILPETTKVRVADERVIESMGSTGLIKVNIQNHECLLDFIILEEMEYDELLGLDFFNKTEACIYPKRRILRFPNEDVLIPKEDRNNECTSFLAEYTIDDEKEIEPQQERKPEPRRSKSHIILNQEHHNYNSSIMNKQYNDDIEITTKKRKRPRIIGNSEKSLQTFLLYYFSV